MNKELKKELDEACARLDILIKAGKEPVDYQKLWKNFQRKQKNR